MGKTAKESQEELNAAFRTLGRSLTDPLHPPLRRLSVFLDRHPGPRWLRVVLSPLDWLGSRFGRFMRWLWR